jgi:hypothetical protein
MLRGKKKALRKRGAFFERLSSISTSSDKKGYYLFYS